MSIPFGAIIFLAVCVAIEQSLDVGLITYVILVVIISFVLSATLTGFLFSSTVQTNKKFHPKIQEIAAEATFDYHVHMQTVDLKFTQNEPNCLLFAENVNEFYHFLSSKVGFSDANRMISTILLDGVPDQDSLREVQKVFPLLSSHHTSTLRTNLKGSAQNIPFYWLPIVRLYADRISVCQDLTFKQQLDAGIRGFDIRMSVLDPNGPNTLENWVVDHNVMFQRASDFFEDVKSDLQQHTFANNDFDAIVCLMIRQSRFSGQPDLVSDSPQRLVEQFFNDNNEHFVQIDDTKACIRFYRISNAYVSVHDSFRSDYDTAEDIVLRDLSLFVQNYASAGSPNEPGNKQHVLQGNIIINGFELFGILMFFFVLSVALALVFRNHVLRWIFVAVANAVFALLLVAIR